MTVSKQETERYREAGRQSLLVNPPLPETPTILSACTDSSLRHDWRMWSVFVQRMWTLKKPGKDLDLDSSFPDFNLISLSVLHLPRGKGCGGGGGCNQLALFFFFVPFSFPPGLHGMVQMNYYYCYYSNYLHINCCDLHHSIFVEHRQEQKSHNLKKNKVPDSTDEQCVYL